MKGRLGVGLAIVVFALVTTGACTDSRGAEQPRQQTYGNADAAAGAQGDGEALRWRTSGYDIVCDGTEQKAGTVDPTAVERSMIGVTVPNLTGGYATMMPNHHLTKPVLIGEIQDDGQFEVVWQTPEAVVGDAWSDYLPGSRDITGSAGRMGSASFWTGARSGLGAGMGTAFASGTHPSAAVATAVMIFFENGNGTRTGTTSGSGSCHEGYLGVR